MAQISRNPLSKKIEAEIRQNLWQVIATLKDKKEASLFLEDLLTETEKTMLSKRLAIALLLEKKIEYRTIRDLLKVSLGTIGSVKIWLDKGGGGYQLAIRKLAKEESMKNFFIEIGQLLNKITEPKTKKDWAKYASGDWWNE